MNVITTKIAGMVAPRSDTSGAAPALAPMTSVAVPPPNWALSALKCAWKSALLPNRRTRNARNVPTVAMMKNVFCQRNVDLVPAISTIVSRAIIAKPPRNTQTWCSFWSLKLWPQSIRVWLLVTAPIETSTGPSAETAKYRAQNVAPMSAERAAAKLLTTASGGDRIRLTQT